MSVNRLGISAAVVLGALTLAVGCKPTYPKCNNTDDCNSDGHKGVCIDGTCQECGSRQGLPGRVHLPLEQVHAQTGVPE